MNQPPNYTKLCASSATTPLIMTYSYGPFLVITGISFDFFAFICPSPISHFLPLAVLLHSSAQSRSPGLRSAITPSYLKLCTRTKFKEHGFHSTRLAAKNGLPDELHRITDTDLFKQRLKTILFSRTYCH